MDVPYICGRMERLFGEREMKQMSPWGIVHREEMEIKGRNQILYNMFGINVVDYLDLYKKFTYTNQESYRLDHIANVELGQRKLDHSEFEILRISILVTGRSLLIIILGTWNLYLV